MTIKDMIDFLERSAKNCKNGVNTNLKIITLVDQYGKMYFNVDDLDFSIERITNSVTKKEHANLIIEEG